MPFALPWFLVVAYWIGFTITWRTLTGHVAWSVHRTATTQKTIRPPVENWIFSAIPCAALALIWPAVLLFVLPWARFSRGAEREAEIMLVRVAEQESWDQIMLENERLDKLLAAGSSDPNPEPENVRGEVEDADYNSPFRPGSWR